VLLLLLLVVVAVETKDGSNGSLDGAKTVVFVRVALDRIRLASSDAIDCFISGRLVVFVRNGNRTSDSVPLLLLLLLLLLVLLH